MHKKIRYEVGNTIIINHDYLFKIAILEVVKPERLPMLADTLVNI